MKIIKYLTLFLVLVILAGAIATFILPTDFSLERKVLIEAPKEVVKNQITYFENASKWSPWAKLDPNQEEWIEGEDGTVGAKQFWKGNKDVGQGNQEIISIEENRIEILVTFIEPFESVANSYFLLDEKENGVEVTWGFDSEMPRPFNLMGLFMNMSEAIGNDYEKGLQNLKEQSENLAENASEWKIEKVGFKNQNYLTLRDRISFDKMEAFFSEKYGTLYAFINKDENLDFAGYPSAIYYDWDEENQETELAATMPFQFKKDAKKITDFKIVNIEGQSLLLTHKGSYDRLGDAHEFIHQYLEDNELKMSEKVLEEYVTDPENEPDTSKWITNIYYFLD